MGVDTDSHGSGEPDDETHPTEEEQVEREWHAWLLGILALGGVALILFPPESWPNLGFALVAVSVVGWILKTVIERTMR